MDTGLQMIRFKRGVNLVFNKFRYKKDRVVNDKQYWRCNLGNGCRGRVHTTGEGNSMQVVHQVEHNHLPDEAQLAFAIDRAESYKNMDEQNIATDQGMFS